MSQYDDRYPELGQFLGGYFHQSWPDDHVLAGAPFGDVVRYFQGTNSAATVSQVKLELEELLELELSENELEEIATDDLGANVYAPGLGLTYRQWLEAILKILQQPVSAERPGRASALVTKRPRSGKR